MESNGGLVDGKSGREEITMTNFEKMMSGESFKNKGLTLEEVGRILCIGVDLTGCSCEDCPFTEHCKFGQNGAAEFLNKEFIDD